jgi:hypothetical protein
MRAGVLGTHGARSEAADSRTALMRLTAPVLLALGFAGLHLVFVATALAPNGTSGEGAAFGFLFYDYPLHVLVNHFNWGAPFRFDSGRHYVLFFSIAGTLMHGAFGFCLGVLGRFCLRLLRATSTHGWSGRES